MSRMRGCHGLELGRSISPRGGGPTFTPRGEGHAVRVREREITETLILIFGRSFRIMERDGQRERGDDVEGDNLFLDWSPAHHRIIAGRQQTGERTV